MIFILPEMLLLLLKKRRGRTSVLAYRYWVACLPCGVVIVVGALAFSGIPACWWLAAPNKTETVSGLMNLVMLPMWVLSGTFFSSKRFPEITQPLIQALPLTQVNDALREVMLEGGIAGQHQAGDC